MSAQFAGRLVARAATFALAVRDVLRRQTLPAFDIPDSLAGRVRAEQVAAVKRLVPVTVPAGIANSALLVLSFADSPYLALLVGWFIANCALGTITLRGWMKARRQPPRSSCGPQVIRRAVRNALVLGGLWSIVALLLFPQADASRQVLLTCLVSGMLSGGAFALSPIPQAALAYVGVIVPVAMMALLMNAGGQLVMASVLLLVFAFFLVRSVLWNSHLFVQHILDQAELQQAALVDPLTGISNRSGLRDALELACLEARAGQGFALAFLDLDRFKDVNDSRGHRVGDAALKTVAARLQAVLGPENMIARVGGDEFIVLLKGGRDRIDELATMLIEKAAEPIVVEGRSLALGASVGIAIAPQDGSDPDDLLNKADLALYRSKRKGGASTTFFSAEMGAAARQKRILEVDLKQALRDGEFRIEYQPIFDVSTRALSGCEALLRWDHPIEGPVSPSIFIPIAEETGLIRDIGEWVLTEATRAAAQWPHSVYVAVNLSPVQLSDPNIAAVVERAMMAAGLDPARLLLEITESVFVRQDTVLHALRQLRQTGVRTALDDFGTGYSSLGYLRRFTLDKLKIDRTFVRDLDRIPENRDIVRAITALARNLGMTTTAEGVERPEELRELVRAGCSEAQGFLFAQPVAAESIVTFLKKQRSAA
jgi:diguanylate cyclase (GGDEF)-like protein